MSPIQIIFPIIFIILGPFVGGLMDGIDRKLSARLQGRIGPSILQPFYDVRKLMNKQVIGVNRAQYALLLSYLLLMIVTGLLFFSGSDILMSVFVLSTASIFLYFAVVETGSPYNTIASNRELVQIMAYEPAVILMCVGFYLVAGYFNVHDIMQSETIMITRMPGFFIAFLFALAVKLRKSPFDVSTGHHAHQELVQGIKTEMGARNLAIFQIAEWYESALLMGMVALFIVDRRPLSFFFGALLVLAVYLFMILLDNTAARIKYTKMLKIVWIATILFSGLNLLVLMLMR